MSGTFPATNAYLYAVVDNKEEVRKSSLLEKYKV